MDQLIVEEHKRDANNSLSRITKIKEYKGKKIMMIVSFIVLVCCAALAQAVVVNNKMFLTK